MMAQVTNTILSDTQTLHEGELVEILRCETGNYFRVRAVGNQEETMVDIKNLRIIDDSLEDMLR